MKYTYLFLICLSANISLAQTLLTSEKIGTIDSLVSHLVYHDQLIGSIAICEHGTELYARNFGEENTGRNTNNTDELLYQIGSITKTVTATLIHKLAEEGSLNVDDKLENYFPTMPNAKNISLRHMLSHRSGLGNYALKQDTIYDWLLQPVVREEIYSEIRRQGVAFPADSTLQYSNSAYFLLARILEKEYKMTYKDIVETHIAKPLGLTSFKAIYGEENEKSLTIASPYERKEGKWEIVDDFYFPNASGAGDIVTTMQDLNTYTNALFVGNIVNKHTIENMKPKSGAAFGEGLMLIPFHDHVSYGHGGTTMGFHSVTAYSPVDGLSISYSINGQYYNSNDFGIDILNIIYEKEAAFPNFDVFDADRSLYPSYEGMYRTEKLPIGIKVFVKEGKLMAQGDGQPAFELTPKGQDVFEFQEAQIRMVFKPSENSVILIQSGMEFELKRE